MDDTVKSIMEQLYDINYNITDPDYDKPRLLEEFKEIVYKRYNAERSHVALFRYIQHLYENNKGCKPNKRAGAIRLGHPVTRMREDENYVYTTLNIILTLYKNTGDFRWDMTYYLVKIKPSLQEEIDRKLRDKLYYDMAKHLPEYFSELVVLDDIIDELEWKATKIIKERKLADAG